MNVGTRTELAALGMALLPALVWCGIYVAWPNPLRHIPAEAAWLFRALLFAGIALCVAAVFVVSVRIRAHGMTPAAVVTIPVAVGFLSWALPLAWRVLEAIFGSRAV